MLGLIKGSTIQSKHTGKNIMQSFRNLVGGELKSYTEMMNDSHEIAARRMVKESGTMGANSIVNVGFTSSSVMQ